MKHTKLLRVLGMATMLSLLLTLLPASPALAAREVTLKDPDTGEATETGEIGEYIDVYGEGFTASTATDRAVDIFMSTQSVDVSSSKYIGQQVTIYERVKWATLVDEWGKIDTSFRIPETLDDGTGTDTDVEIGTTYYIYVTREYTNPDSPTTLIATKNTLLIGGGEISIDPESGPVDTGVTITGAGFADNQDITVEFDGTELTIDSGDDETDSNGDFELTILVPEGTAGDHTISVTVNNFTVEATFAIEPDIYLTQTSGSPGTTVTVDGTGFGRREDASIYFNNSLVASGCTSRDGSFIINFTVPDLPADLYDLEAEDDSGNTASAGFTVIVSPSDAAEILTYGIAGQVGETVIDSGEGTIDVVMPYGTDVSALVATFTTSPDIQSIKLGVVDQVSGETANDFTDPVTYVVTAQDGTTKNWTVTVTVAPTYDLPPDDMASVTLDADWNLLSTPILLDENSDTVEHIFSTASLANIDVSYRWDAENQQWVQITASYDYELAPLDTIYIKVKADTEVTAEFILSQELSALPSRELSRGLNLIGSAPALTDSEFPAMPLDLALASIAEAGGGLKGYTMVISPAHNQAGWTYAVGGEIPELLPFKGYWVVMENDDTYYGFSTTPVSP